MKKRIFSGIAVAVLLTSMFTLAFNVQPAKATGTIHIRADGSIEPSNARIFTPDNVTYILVDNIYGQIVVERNNIVIDGNRRTLQGSGSGDGFYFFNANNVTLKNTNIKNYSFGIRLNGSSNNKISANNVTDNVHGIWLAYSSGNTIFHNNFVNNTFQVYSPPNESLTNVWDNGYPLGGNYCSDHADVDQYSGPYQNETGSDGIWDHPYVVDASNQDRYPFVGLWIHSPIGDLAEETIRNLMLSADLNHDGFPDYAWTSGYNISFLNQTLRVEIDIQLVGDDPGDASRQQWTSGIEGVWSNRYCIIDGTYAYPIQLNVDWVDTNPHHVVTVHAGTVDVNMLNWHTNTPGVTVAHEAGHMLGLYDEYMYGAVDPDTLFTTTNSLMADLGPTRIWNYEEMLEWLETRSGRKLSLALQPPPALWDVAITNLVPSKTVIGEGSTTRIWLTLRNQGSYSETFNATAYANTTIIAVFTNITLTSGKSTTIIFPWDTSGFVKGRFAISAYATPVQGETDTADNSFNGGVITVAMVGDISGLTRGVPDGKCDIRDLAAIAKHLGHFPPDSHDPDTSDWILCFNADISGRVGGVADGKVDTWDSDAAAKNFGGIDL